MTYFYLNDTLLLKTGTLFDAPKKGVLIQINGITYVCVNSKKITKNHLEINITNENK